MRLAQTFVALPAVVVCAAQSGCAPLPSLVFTSEDAGVDGAIAAPDSGPTGAPDAASNDASGIVDAALDQHVSPLDAALDALPPNTCPDATPAGATVCCGSIPCTGANLKRCNAACTSCEGACNVGQTCCLDKNGTFAACSAVACP